jgi:hypothetical protein
LRHTSALRARVFLLIHESYPEPSIGSSAEHEAVRLTVCTDVR